MKVELRFQSQKFLHTRDVARWINLRACLSESLVWESSSPLPMDVHLPTSRSSASCVQGGLHISPAGRPTPTVLVLSSHPMHKFNVSPVWHGSSHDLIAALKSLGFT